MKLECMIPPRKDGTVTARFGESAYVFRDDGTGSLVCEVEDDGDIAALLNRDGFMPASESDFDAAVAIASGGEDEGDEVDEAGQPPIESNTPPRRGRKPRGS